MGMDKRKRGRVTLAFITAVGVVIVTSRCKADYFDVVLITHC